MKNKRWVIIFIIFSMVLLSGCKRELKEIKEKIYGGASDEIISPLSGLYAKKSLVEQRPVAIMFDNHPNARWQSGLGQAEIVYEYKVENPYTRYMGIFLINEPESIGPIRSARPYFITTLLEYDPIYVRVGGSAEAKHDIIEFDVADIDGLTSPNSVLWRNQKVNKVAPHNLYTSMSAIRLYQEEKGYKDTGDYEGFNFHDKEEDLDGFSAGKVLINYCADNNTFYEYDEGEKVYLRYKDDQAHLDELDSSHIKAKNIIIQKASTNVVDGDGRLEIGLIGEGQGNYITNGKGIPIKWSKESRRSKTRYYDEMGGEVVLNPGTTWVQVVDMDSNINIE